MGILASILGWLFGRGMMSLTFPAVVIACITFGSLWWQKRDARLIAQGEMVCRADWEQRVRDAEVQKAQAAIDEIKRQAEAERQSADDLRSELQTVRGEMDTLRSSANAADDKCLSDGVLDTLRSRQPTGKGQAKKRPPLTN